MGRSKLIDRVVVDNLTGEILESRTSFVKLSSERYVMFRLTDGVDWVFGLSRSELSVLFGLSNYADGYGCVSLSKSKRLSLLNYVGIGERMMRRVLLSLIEKGMIKRVESGDYYVNPTYLFKCGVKDLADRIFYYQNL